MRAYLYWFLLAGVLLALWAQWRLRSAYRRWSGQARAARPLTGAGAAREILDAAGLADVPVERTGTSARPAASGFRAPAPAPVRGRAALASARRGDRPSAITTGTQGQAAHHGKNHRGKRISLRISCVGFQVFCPLDLGIH